VPSFCEYARDARYGRFGKIILPPRRKGREGFAYLRCVLGVFAVKLERLSSTTQEGDYKNEGSEENGNGKMGVSYIQHQL
jgi:hypothetical protein